LSTAIKLNSSEIKFNIVGLSDPVLVEKNIGLLRAVVSKFSKFPKIEDSDFYSIACLALVQAAASFDPSKSKFSTWATKIMTQKIIEQIRRNKKQNPVHLSSLEPGEQDSCLIDKKESTFPVHLLSLIAPNNSDTKIEKESKSIISMHYLDGKSWSEIGRSLGMTREGVRQRAIKMIDSIRDSNFELLKDYL
jgi:RNA polymerase sigma factor (sigma-70 family)